MYFVQFFQKYLYIWTDVFVAINVVYWKIFSSKELWCPQRTFPLGVKTVFAFVGLIKLVSAACVFSFCAQEDGLLFFGGLD